MFLREMLKVLAVPFIWIKNLFRKKRKTKKPEFQMSKTSDTYRMIIDQIKAQVAVTIVSGVRAKQFNFSEDEALRLSSVIDSVIDTEAASGYEKISNSFNDDLAKKIAEAKKRSKAK